MKRFLLVFLAITVGLFLGVNAMFTDNSGVLPDLPKPKNPGKFVPWECTFEADHMPPLSDEADILFQEARTLQKSSRKFTAGEEEHIFEFYINAARQGHWKAMNNLINCYIKGFGTERNLVEANQVADQMVSMGVPAGFYNKYVILSEGYGIEADQKEAMEMLHKAADFGYPMAQYRLGFYYIYPEDRDAQELQYLICATRQGHAESAKEVAGYLEIKKNYIVDP